MNIVEMVKSKPSPGKTADLIHRLSSELDDARAQVASINREWMDALAREQEAGGADSSSSDELEKLLSRAQKVEAKAAAALSAVRSRAAASEAEAGRSAEAAQWVKAESLAEDREKLVVRLATSAKNLADDFRALQEITGKIYDTLPAVPDPDGALLMAPKLQGLITRELRRLGFEGEKQAAIMWDLPTLPEVFKGVPGLIHGWAQSAMNKKR